MKALYLTGLALLLASCDGGGAEVNLNQNQGQDQRPNDNLNPVPTPFDPGPFCEKACNRRFNGLIDVITTCADGTQSIEVLTFLPRDCDTVNDVTPTASSGGHQHDGLAGQETK